MGEAGAATPAKKETVRINLPSRPSLGGGMPTPDAPKKESSKLSNLAKPPVITPRPMTPPPPAPPGLRPPRAGRGAPADGHAGRRACCARRSGHAPPARRAFADGSPPAGRARFLLGGYRHAPAPPRLLRPRRPPRRRARR